MSTMQDFYFNCVSVADVKLFINSCNIHMGFAETFILKAAS